MSPRQFGVNVTRFDGETVVFTLMKPEYISVRFICPENTDEYNQIRHGLMIFADNPETDVPDPKSSHVTVYSPKADLQNARFIYFKPGVYDLFDDLPNATITLHDDQAVYIHGNAYVHGAIGGASTWHTKLYGRGILSGARHRFHYDGIRQLAELDTWNYRTNIHRGSHNTVTGVTFVEPFNHTLVVPTDSYVKNVKFIAWRCNNDGLRSGDRSIIAHVFMMGCDD